MLGVVLLSQLGESDCEAIGSGFLKQPINGVSSLAFTAVGTLIAISAARAHGTERTLRIVFGVLMALTGIGSFLFHGPQTAGSQFLHDISFLATVWFLVSFNGTAALGWPVNRGWVAWVAGTAMFVVVLGLAPSVTNAFTAGLVVALVASDLAIHRRGGIRAAWYGAAVAALLIAVVFMIAGNSSSPLCDPGSVLQAHGGWHLFIAIAVGSYFVAMTDVRAAAFDREGAAA